MKRTWVVYVSEGVGHEMHDSIVEAQWFGPYTQAQAEALESKLNEILDSDESEHPEASAMPLDSLSPRQVLRLFKTQRAGQTDEHANDCTASRPK